jgi:ubiquinone/menaquinone biosynthesis C-methylase UbiE
LSKYDRISRRYDSRWRAYVQESIRRTLAHVDVHAGQTLLDVGCGTGQLLAGVADASPQARLAGVDLSRGMLNVARRRVPSARLIQGRAEQLPVPSGSIDWLVTASMFHYIQDPFAARREFRRVLRPGGTLVLTDWSADYPTMRLQARWSKATDRSFRHVYTALELQAILVAAGFDVAVETYKINWYWGLMTVTAIKAR